MDVVVGFGLFGMVSLCVTPLGQGCARELQKKFDPSKLQNNSSAPLR